MPSARSRPGVKLAAIILLAMAASAAGPSWAWAHTTRAVELSPAPPSRAMGEPVCCEPQTTAPVAATPMAPSAPTASVAVVIFGLAILLALTLRHRRTLTLGLIIALAILTFETGVHSVHHLGSPADASQCAVVGATTHLHGAVDEPSVTLAGPAYVGPAPVAPDPARLVLPTWPAWRGRAPPASSIV